MVNADTPSRYRAIVLSQPLMSEVIPAGQQPLSALGYFISSLNFLPQPCVRPWTATTKWMDSTTSSTKRTKEAPFKSPFPSVMLVCPADSSAPAEWFLYDICSGGRQHIVEARLRVWLAVQLRGWLRILTGSLVMTNILNYDVFHDTFGDVTFHFPESARPILPQPSAPPQSNK